LIISTLGRGAYSSVGHCSVHAGKRLDCCCDRYLLSNRCVGFSV